MIVKQFAPNVFREIRRLNNIKDEDLIRSLDPSQNIKNIQNAGEGAGASGSFFFFASDRKFIMKTMSSREVDQLIRVLPSYYEHLDKNKDSTIAKMYGIFEIRIDMFEPISVMIMQNTLPAVPDTDLHFVFDMKGSQINREVLKDHTIKHMEHMKHTGGTVLKDLDYIRLKEVKKFFQLDYPSVKEILGALQKDVDWLVSSRFMDYSLLFAVRKVNMNSDHQFDPNGLWDKAIRQIENITDYEQQALKDKLKRKLTERLVRKKIVDETLERMDTGMSEISDIHVKEGRK